MTRNIAADLDRWRQQAQFGGADMSQAEALLTRYAGGEIEPGAAAMGIFDLTRAPGASQRKEDRKAGRSTEQTNHQAAQPRLADAPDAVTLRAASGATIHAYPAAASDEADALALASAATAMFLGKRSGPAAGAPTAPVQASQPERAGDGLSSAELALIAGAVAGVVGQPGTATADGGDDLAIASAATAAFLAGARP